MTTDTAQRYNGFGDSTLENPIRRRLWAAAKYDVATPTHGRWPIALNPRAGVVESRWLNEHRAEIADPIQPWVAIRGEQVIARATTAAELFSALNSRQDAQDALVVSVRPKTAIRVNRIA
jgi:hypothetical protein